MAMCCLGLHGTTSQDAIQPIDCARRIIAIPDMALVGSVIVVILILLLAGPAMRDWGLE